VNKITQDLPTPTWKRIIDDIYQMGCTVIFVEGGEPTLRPDLEKLIDYMKNKGFKVVLFSNGTRPINHLEPDAIWISIDGIEEHHNKIRGTGTFQKIMHTLKDNPEKNILSITTLSKLNVGRLEELCQVLSNTSLKGLIFNYMYPYQGIRLEALSREERVHSARRLMELKRIYPKIASSDSYLKMVGQKDKVCYPWILMLATADGKLTHGCTVEPTEDADCGKCDMMCGLEASAGFDLRPDSIAFWNKSNFLPPSHLVPGWITKLLNNDWKN